MPDPTSWANAACAACNINAWESPQRAWTRTHLVYPGYLSLLLFKVMFPLLACFVQTSYIALPVALVSQPIFVLLFRRSIVGNVDLAVCAVVFLVRNPVFAHFWSWWQKFKSKPQSHDTTSLIITYLAFKDADRLPGCVCSGSWRL